VAGPAAAAGPLLGRVTAFDATRGLGTVTGDDGATYAFHATAIADGSRRIEVGATVSFLLAPGHRGAYEARALTTVVEGSGAASR
jgi:cold shock CspA family protein